MVNERNNNNEPISSSVGSLKSRVLQAGSWVLVGFGTAQVLRLLGNLIMTRLLEPHVFGIMAIATAINVVVSLLADMGMFQAIIQSPNGANRTFLNTAWTIHVLRGWLVWGACICVAIALRAVDTWNWLPPDSVYADPIVPAIIVATSFSSVIIGFVPTKAILAYRDMNVSRIIYIDLISLIATLSVSIFLGWLTHSIWSFVAGGLVGSVFTTVLSHVCLPGQADRFAWDREALHELRHFGRWIFLSSAATVLATNGDRLMLGLWVDATSLGFYSIAFSLATIFDGLATRLLSRVSLPALSEVVRDYPDRLRAIYIRLRWLADAAYISTAGFLFAASEFIVSLMYDARYASAGPMLQVLSFSLLFSRYGLAHNVYLALGRPSYLTAISITRMISLYLLVPVLFYAFGIWGAIAGIALHQLPTVLLVFWFNQRHGLNNPLQELVVLGMWPIGWLAGSALVSLVHFWPQFL